MNAPDLSWTGASLGAGWQGIRRLVLQPGEPTVLQIHLAQAADGFTARHVTLRGPRPLDVAVVFPDDGQGGRAARIDLQLAQIGGRGAWEVELSAPVGVPLHPFFARASFEFSIDCDNADCRASTRAALAPSSSPAVDLLSKDFDGLVTLLAERAQNINPHWSDLSSASFERVLVDLLAHHGDMLSYYQDRVIGEAFLDTASQRFSLQQHALLLGHRLGQNLAATTLLAVEVGAAGTVPDGLVVRGLGRADEARVEFTVTAPAFVDPELNGSNLAPAQWSGAHDAVLPAGATSILLDGHHPKLRVGATIVIEQGGRSWSRTPTTIELLRLPGWVADPDDPPTTATRDVTRLSWAERLDQAVPVADPGAPLGVHANLVEARHGRMIRAWLLAGGGTTVPREQPVITLARHNCNIERVVDDGGERWLLRALRLPGGPLLHDRNADGRAIPAVTLTIDDQPWHRQDHLHRSRGFDPHYFVSIDNDGGAWLNFGDGERGRAVELSPAIPGELSSARPHGDLEIGFRVGDPLVGNCAIDRVTEIVAASVSSGELGALAISSIRNVVPGVGGRRADSLDAARRAIPASLRHGPLERAVSLSDYARAAEQADPRVERAIVRELGGVFSTVLVLVDEAGTDELSPELQRVVEARLDALRMVGREIVVRSPSYVPLDVELAICPAPTIELHRLREAIYAALRPGDAARPGWFHPDRLSFGQRLELGHLLAHVQRLTGVAAVKALRFCRLDAASPGVHELAFSSREIPRLDADEANPQHGRLRVRVHGLDLESSVHSILTLAPEIT